MTAASHPNETQQQRVLRIFTVLHHLQPRLPAPDWGGQIILSLGLNPQGAALALASNIAGAVCLSLEEDAFTAHAALRSGACDFVVNTLDEALRAMKNEVRKHLPLSVGLQGDRTHILEEILERGLLPQLVSDFTGDPTNTTGVHALQLQGAFVLDFGPISTSAALAGEVLLQEILHQNQWHLETFLQPTASALRAFDIQALALTPPNDALRAKWLHAAPKILPREAPLHRSLWLSEAENSALRKS